MIDFFLNKAVFVSALGGWMFTQGDTGTNLREERGGQRSRVFRQRAELFNTGAQTHEAVLHLYIITGRSHIISAPNLYLMVDLEGQTVMTANTDCPHPHGERRERASSEIVTRCWSLDQRKCHLQSTSKSRQIRDSWACTEPLSFYPPYSHLPASVRPAHTLVLFSWTSPDFNWRSCMCPSRSRYTTSSLVQTQKCLSESMCENGNLTVYYY